MSSVSVSRDGKRLVFLAWSGHPTLNIADLQSSGTRISNERHFTGTESSEMWADWTPDSSTLIFVSDRSGRPAVYRQPLAAKDPELLISSQPGLAACCVSSDGRWFIYRVRERSSQPLDSTEIVMRFPLTGGPPEKVMTVKRLSWSTCARAPSRFCAIAETTEDRKLAIVAAFDPVAGKGAELFRVAIEPNR